MMILFYVISFIATLACGFVLLWAFLAFKNHRKFSHFPGPPLDSFFLGHLPGVNKYKKDGKFVSLYIYDCHMEYGLTFRMFFGFEPVIVTCDPKTAREMKNKFPKNHAFSEEYFANFCGSRFLGRGLFSIVDPKEHRERRLFLNPAFHKTALLSLMNQFNSSTTALINKLREMCAVSADGSVNVHISDLLGKTTLDVIAKVAFGLELNSVQDVDSKFTKSISDLLNVWMENVMDPLMQYKPWRQKEIAQAHENIKFLRNYAQEIIVKRKMAICNGDKDFEEDILSMMLKYQEENSDYSIEEQVDDFITIFIAGQETTATNLTSTLMYLDRNPEWKKLASQEAEEVLGLKDNVDYSDLNNLTITTNCLKESLRLAPPAAIMDLQPTMDFCIPQDPMWDEIEDGLSARPCIHRQVGKEIAPGTRVLISIYTMHRHSRFWSNADTYKPNRWAAKTKETSVPMSFIPFSMGSRNCIGQVFAQMEAKIILSRFLRAFDYESLDGHRPDEFDENLTLHLRHGLTVRLKPKE